MQPKVWSTLAVVVASLACAGAAHADEITTRNGSFYRGEIVERVVGDHVTIKLVSGELRRIEWADLAPPAAPSPPPAAAPTPIPSAWPQAPAGAQPVSRVNVVVRADEDGASFQAFRGESTIDVDHVTPMGVTVWTSQAQQQQYTHLCSAPCSMLVDPGGTFRIAGEGLQPTRSFRLTEPYSTIEAKMRSLSRRNAGRGLTFYAGAPLTTVGGLLLAIGAVSSSRVACDGCVNMQATMLLWGGIVGAIGVASLATGIGLWATSTSKVSVNGVEVALPGRAVLKMDGVHF